MKIRKLKSMKLEYWIRFEYRTQTVKHFILLPPGGHVCVVKWGERESGENTAVSPMVLATQIVEANLDSRKIAKFRMFFTFLPQRK